MVDNEIHKTGDGQKWEVTGIGYWQRLLLDGIYKNPHDTSLLRELNAVT